MGTNSQSGPPPYLVAKWRTAWETVDQAIKSLTPQSPNFQTAARGAWEQLGVLFDLVSEAGPPSPDPFGVLSEQYRDLGTVIESDSDEHDNVLGELERLQEGVDTHWGTL